MKYKLLKEFPGYKIGDYLNDYDALFKNIAVSSFPDFFEPILEKKTYDDLKEGDKIYIINEMGNIIQDVFTGDCRSGTFLTREEAEDEHKRREFSVRPDKFYPKLHETYFTFSETGLVHRQMCVNDFIDIIFINSGLAFRTREDCQDAIDNHDLVRLFYSIR